MALILVAEPSAPVAATLRRFLEGAGHEVVLVGRVAEGVWRVQELAPDAVLAACSSGLDGEDLCRRVKAEAPHLPVLLLYPPEEELAEARAAAAGAEACLVGPLKRANVLSTLGLMLRVASTPRPESFFEAEINLATEAVEIPTDALPASSQEEPSESPPAPALVRVDTSPDLDFLKRLLFMELKRSRRYRYPIAFLLLEPDRFAEKTTELSALERTQVLAEVLFRITQALREIDLAVPFAAGRFIVFLPHTPFEGARVVAERLLQRVKEVQGVQGLTASLGLSVFEPLAGPGQSQVSFGSLLKEASDALRRAQSAGGDRVEVGERTRQDPFALE